MTSPRPHAGWVALRAVAAGVLAGAAAIPLLFVTGLTIEQYRHPSDIIGSATLGEVLQALFIVVPIALLPIALIGLLIAPSSHPRRAIGASYAAHLVGAIVLSAGWVWLPGDPIGWVAPPIAFAVIGAAGTAVLGAGARLARVVPTLLAGIGAFVLAVLLSQDGVDPDLWPLLIPAWISIWATATWAAVGGANASPADHRSAVA